MQSYLFILLLVRTILVAERVSGSLHGTEITKDLRDFADVASEHPIEEGSDENTWQLVGLSKGRKGAEGSSFEWEHVTHNDHQEGSEDEILSAEVEADPMICEICSRKMAGSEPIYSKPTLSCLHRFHSACIDTPRSKYWGYKCPACHGPEGIIRAREELQQQRSADYFFFSLSLLVSVYLLGLLIALAGPR